MAEQPLSVDDDSSAASSGDEMLNMIVPFSQDSAERRKSRDAAGQLPGNTKKRKHEAISVEDRGEDAIEMEEKARARASRAFEIAFHDTKVGAPDKLFWHELSRKTVKMIFPVRIVPREEAVGLALGKSNDGEKLPFHYIKYPGESQYGMASRRSLSPYHGKGEVGDRWCPTKFERYSKQLKKSQRELEGSDLKNEESFLRCVLDKSLVEGERERERAEVDAQVDEAVPEEISAAKTEEPIVDDRLEEEDDDGDARGSRRSTRRSTGMQEKPERLRAGDRIAFYDPAKVAGDPDALLEATILHIDPEADHVLTVDDAFVHLAPHHQVKRVRRSNRRGKLVDNHGAQFRPINRYALEKEGDPDALRKLIAGDAARGFEIIRRNGEVAEAKMKRDGINLKDVFRK